MLDAAMCRGLTVSRIIPDRAVRGRNQVGRNSAAILARMLRSWFSWLLLAAVFACCSHDQPLKWQLAADGLPQDGLWKSTPVLADVNGDGFTDLAAIARLGHGARVWLGNGKGNWRESSGGLALPISCGGGVAFGDLNKDGHPDLAVADHCAGVYVYLGDGRGGWTVTTQALNPAKSQTAPSLPDGDGAFLGAEDVAIGDVNEDGFPDLVVASRREGGITVYFGDGSGKRWTEAHSDGLPKSGWANQLLLRDIDGDGHLDIVAAYYAGPRVWRGDGKGHWQEYSQGLPHPNAGGLYRGIAVGDINEDGRLDIAAANLRGGPELYLQTEDGRWQRQPKPLPAMTGARAIALADLDRDGHLDLVVGGQRSGKIDYGLAILRGDGKGGWTELQGTNLPNTGLPVIWGLAVGDVDRDGLPDLAVTTGTLPVQRQKDEMLPRLQVWFNRYHDRASAR